MTIQNLIDKHIRPKLDDQNDVRWSDTNLVNMIIEVVDQLDSICNRFNLQFAKKKATLTTTINQDYISLATLSPPLASIIHVFRPATKKKLIHETEEDWESIYTTGELIHCLWYDDKLYLKGTPSAEESLTLWYWPNIDASAYTVNSTLPWSGRMDFVIAQHVILLCQNVDEMDITMDNKFTKSLERAVARKFSGLFPKKIRGKGWLKGASSYSKV